ncbi:transposase [Pseudoalteromonas phenolica]|uniref:transposase n=1 Tax=Pseudoalteromonas phenolica TaxID=161398 RepID=UPI0024B60094|nr:transposase [Pseudoalteromonas phenolica]
MHAFVPITNHVHLLATPTTSNGISKFIQCLERYYVRYFNQTYKRTGTLWNQWGRESMGSESLILDFDSISL